MPDHDFEIALQGLVRSDRRKFKIKRIARSERATLRTVNIHCGQNLADFLLFKRAARRISDSDFAHQDAIALSTAAAAPA